MLSGGNLSKNNAMHLLMCSSPPPAPPARAPRLAGCASPLSCRPLCFSGAETCTNVTVSGGGELAGDYVLTSESNYAGESEGHILQAIVYGRIGFGATHLLRNASINIVHHLVDAMVEAHSVGDGGATTVVLTNGPFSRRF